MKKFIRLVVGVAALAAVVGWTVALMSVKDWRAPMAGAGDGAGTESPSASEQYLDAVLIGALWLVPTSPYLCMAAGAFNLLTGKLLRVANVYTLVVLALMTIIMLVSSLRRLEMIAMGNIIVGGLWAYAFREKPASQ